MRDRLLDWFRRDWLDVLAWPMWLLMGVYALISGTLIVLMVANLP